MSNQLDWPRYSRWTWIIAISALLALLWLWMSGRGPNSAGCCGAPTAAVVAPVAAAATVAAVVAAPTMAQAVKASWDGAKLTLEGVVGSEATKKAMLDAAIAKYGAGNVIDKLTVDATAKGDVKITLSGEVDSDAVKASRGAEAQAFYPGTTIDNQLSVKVAAAVPAAPAATADDVKCGDSILVAANFATGSARLSPDMAKVLSAVVPCIKGPYEVGGHTDNVGDDAPNQVLSDRRARAVAGFLASKGVDAKLLSSKGYGETAPMADNGSAEGRAKNRRIEFKKM
jgi:outer membrane protein OmpA-like peptidoglycan-associated protein